MLRRLLLLLAILCPSVLAQQIPIGGLQLHLERQNGAWMYISPSGGFTYVPGVGWAPPLLGSLPPPVDDSTLSLSVLRAAGVLPPSLREAPIRYAHYTDWLRLVVDLPRAWSGPGFQGSVKAQAKIFVPFLLTYLPKLAGLSAAYGPSGTTLTYQPAPGRLLYLHTFALEDPARFVIDLYFPTPPVSEGLAPGFNYQEAIEWIPFPLKLRMVTAAPGRWRLVPVGTPGLRKTLSSMAPDALAVLNGGYFDPRTNTPIGLWVRGGVPINYPYGRTALLWNGENLFAAVPRFKAWVVTANGQSRAVGINRWPAKLTAYTLPGPAGQAGQDLLIIKGDHIAALVEAPHKLQPGYWALSFPHGLMPWASLAAGGKLSLFGSLDPPVNYALEAGPLLVQSGKLAYDPEKGGFKAGAPQLGGPTPQAAVAWTKDGRIWLVTSDPTTPEVLAKALLKLGAWGAIRMDSGGSAQLSIDGRLVYPTQARAVVSALALYPLPPLAKK